jgi:hypothetical protein
MVLGMMGFSLPHNPLVLGSSPSCPTLSLNDDEMKTKFYHVYQFKITLEDVDPPIWRQVQVPEYYTFWDFHVALQDAMGWTDSHLHQFEIKKPKTQAKEVIGVPEEFYDGICDGWRTLPGWKFLLRDYFSEENRTIFYLYDFGDGWNHRIEYEGIFFKKDKLKYPLCVSGERACPPEDCGGYIGYKRLLEILKNPKDKEYKEMKAWVGKNLDPEKFNVTKIRFNNPDLHWNKTWGNSSS